MLADWLISAANAHDFPVQSTSIPGVAQRTGATTYYVEIFPVTRKALGSRRPVLSLTPSPGDVDVAVASELIEATRIVQSGYAHPKRTAIIGSTHREYAVSEKMAMADGRYDVKKAADAVRTMSRICALFDMRALAWANATVINTVMFGAMAGSGVLPLSRAACEEAIRASGKAVEASLKGFAAGYAAAQASAAEGTVSRLPTPTLLRDVVQSGIELTTDYQDARYAAHYQLMVEDIQALEIAAGGGPGGLPVTTEVARYLALWMCYEDVIRVADLKTRLARLEKVRQETAAKAADVVRLTEFLKPGVEELTSILPRALARWVRKKVEGREARFNIGLQIRTDTVAGFSALCILRAFRVWRRRSSRFYDEHALIEQWLEHIRALLALPEGRAVAHEIALAGNLVKGYGQTHARGRRNLHAILGDLDAQHNLKPGELTDRVKRAREAALADPDGRDFAQALGLPLHEPVVKPVNFIRRSAGT